MLRSGRTITTMLVAGLVLCTGAAFAGSRVGDRYPGTILVGNRVYAGSQLTLVQVERLPFVKLQLDGRTIATFALESSAAIPDGGSCDVVFYGRLGEPKQLVGIRNLAGRPVMLEHPPVGLAALGEGETATFSARIRRETVATVPSGSRVRPPDA
jgi:hypothetical protein